MSIITISRGSYSKGKDVAEKVAQKLGYECIARDAIIDASEEFNIPEIRLVRAIHDAPSILDRFSYSREKYLAYLKVALLEHFQKDNVVYHGLAGHFFIEGVSHLLKVRIIADMNDRVKLEMELEGISRKEALRILKSDDSERKKWSKYLYGIDTWDSSLYDLVIHIKKITVNDAVDVITHTVGLNHFKTTPESQKVVDDLLLAAKVRISLIDLKPDIEVSAKDGIVFIKTKSAEFQEEELVSNLEEAARSIPGVKDVKVRVSPSIPFGN
jgi:cytidylate kinase